MRGLLVKEHRGLVLKWFRQAQPPHGGFKHRRATGSTTARGSMAVWWVVSMGSITAGSASGFDWLNHRRGYFGAPTERSDRGGLGDASPSIRVWWFRQALTPLVRRVVSTGSTTAGRQVQAPQGDRLNHRKGAQAPQGDKLKHRTGLVVYADVADAAVGGDAFVVGHVDIVLHLEPIFIL